MHTDWGRTTIGDALRATAGRVPDRLAVAGPGERVTFAELDRQADELARGLMALGVSRGDHVALWMANCALWIAVWVACTRIGVVLVPINTRFKDEEVRYILKQSDAKVLIAMDRFFSIDYEAAICRIVPAIGSGRAGPLHEPSLPTLRSVVLWTDAPRPGFTSLSELLAGGVDADAFAARERETSPRDPVIIVYTSGTTGHPKGAVHSHIVLKNAANVARVMRIGPEDVILGHMPLYHVAGAFTATLPALMLGCSLIMLPHWDPRAALDLIARERVTIFGGIPTHFVDMLDAIREAPRDTTCLRTAWIGGAPVTPDVAQAALAELGLGTLQAVYGMTETTAATVFSEFDGPLDILCENKGRPIGEFEVKACDPQTGEERATGENGEVWVRGHLVMDGYYKNPAATAEVMTPDGWFKTGDVGHFDGDGYLKITGRVKDMFIVGGSNTYPAEIERMLQAHPAIKQAVVVGAPDRRLGEVGYAFLQVEGADSPSPEEIITYCKSNMADYKVPRHVAFVEDFPRTTTGKIQRFVLSERAHAAVRETH